VSGGILANAWLLRIAPSRRKEGQRQMDGPWGPEEGGSRLDASVIHFLQHVSFYLHLKFGLL
jgi:hypothetical protein